MALAKKKSNSTRLVVVGITILAVLGVGYLLFKQFFLNNSNTSGQAFNASRTSSIVTNFGESFLQDSRFTTLKSFETTVNVNADTDGGQVNPFQ